MTENTKTFKAGDKVPEWVLRAPTRKRQRYARFLSDVTHVLRNIAFPQGPGGS